jgi:hypothetical protein
MPDILFNTTSTECTRSFRHRMSCIATIQEKPIIWNRNWAESESASEFSKSFTSVSNFQTVHEPIRIT